MFRAIGLIMVLMVVGLADPVREAAAAGTVSDCSEPSLDAAIATGGAVTFACSGVIPITTTKTIGDGQFLSLDGSNQSVTLDGGGTVQLFTVAPGGTLVFNHLTLTNGRGFQGGAVWNRGHLRVSDSAFSAHVSLDRGGAIGSFGSSANLVIQSSVFVGNMGFGGGAVANGAFLGLPGNMTVRDTAFRENQAQFGGALLTGGEALVSGSRFSDNHASGNGGAVTNARNLTLEHSEFTSNTSGGGGGAIENTFSAALTARATTFRDQRSGLNGVGTGGAILNQGRVAIAHSAFDSNSARTSGGAVYSSAVGANPSALDIDHTQFTRNSTSGWGGALIVAGPVTVAISNSRFFENAAVQGGAILMYPAFGVPNVTASRVEFLGNIASTLGGAIVNYGQFNFDGGLINGNSAVTTGGVFNAGNLQLRFAVILQNGGGDCNSTGTLTDAGHNLTGDGSCGL